mgnify:CR=1 FL=1
MWYVYTYYLLLYSGSFDVIFSRDEKINRWIGVREVPFTIAQKDSKNHIPPNTKSSPKAPKVIS